MYARPVSEETALPDRIDYPRLVQDALRGVVRQAMEQVAESGLPGDHHFLIGFRTEHPGVVVPRFLRELYPDEIKIVLQNQFWDLEVDEQAFSVTLTFNGARHRLIVPLEALTVFVDPAAELMLRFDGGAASREEPEAPAAPVEAAAEPAGDRAGEVLRFDPKRRK